MHKLVRPVLVAAMATMLPMLALAAEGNFDRRLTVKGPVLLSVETGAGYIQVHPGNANEVHVVAHVHSGNGWSWGGSSSGTPEERVKQVVTNPPISQTGNIISIGKNMPVRNVSIDYEITTPRGTDLHAESGSGDIRISDNGGPVILKTGSGSIDASGLSDHVNLETGSGNIHAAMLSSLDVKAQTGSGSIELKNVQGSLWANTGSGDLRISGKPSSGWKLETGSGSVTLELGGAPISLDAETGSGSVQTTASLSGPGSGDKHHVIGNLGAGGPKVRISTGSGDIRIQ